MKAYICEEGHITVIKDNEIIIADQCPETWEIDTNTCDKPGCMVYHTPYYQTVHCKKPIKELVLK